MPYIDIKCQDPKVVLYGSPLTLRSFDRVYLFGHKVYAFDGEEGPFLLCIMRASLANTESLPEGTSVL